MPVTDQLKTCLRTSSDSTPEDQAYSVFAAIIHLIHLVPCGVQISLDNLAGKRLASNVDLHIGVTFAFHHAPHQVVFGDEVLACQEVDPEQTLGGGGAGSHMFMMKSQSNLKEKRGLQNQKATIAVHYFSGERGMRGGMLGQIFR